MPDASRNDQAKRKKSKEIKEFPFWFIFDSYTDSGISITFIFIKMPAENHANVEYSLSISTGGCNPHQALGAVTFHA